jgi:hypothetical protein
MNGYFLFNKKTENIIDKEGVVGNGEERTKKGQIKKLII